MMNAKKAAFVLMSGALLLATQARANSVGTASDISLFDVKDMQFLVGGFAEFDAINDSAQGLTEVVGNGAIKPQTPLGGITGNEGQTIFSIRNSRFDFTAIGPNIDGWTDYGYMEFDLLGYEPGISASAPKESEGSYWDNPTLRVRHMYAAAQNGGFKFLAGQYWGLFGFSPDYVLDTVSEAQVRAEVYYRTPQLTAYYTAGDDSDAVKVNAALSMERPPQMASEIPSGVAALRLDLPGWMGAYSSGSSSHVKLAQASFAVSGKINTFALPNQSLSDVQGGTQDVSSTTNVTGGAVAFDALIPIIPVTDKNFMSSLVLTGEFTSGSGDAEEFGSWGGGESQLTAGNASGATPGSYKPATPSLDAGQGGYYSNNSFHLMNLQTFTFGAQYNLPSDWATYFNAGYSALYCDNVAAMTGSDSSFTDTYNEVTGWYANMSHDWSKSLRSSLELDHFTTTYVHNAAPGFNYAVDNRIMLSMFYLM